MQSNQIKFKLYLQDSILSDVNLTQTVSVVKSRMLTRYNWAKADSSSISLLFFNIFLLGSKDIFASTMNNMVVRTYCVHPFVVDVLRLVSTYRTSYGDSYDTVAPWNGIEEFRSYLRAYVDSLCDNRLSDLLQSEVSLTPDEADKVVSSIVVKLEHYIRCETWDDLVVLISTSLCELNSVKLGSHGPVKFVPLSGGLTHEVDAEKKRSLGVRAYWRLRDGDYASNANSFSMVSFLLYVLFYEKTTSGCSGRMYDMDVPVPRCNVYSLPPGTRLSRLIELFALLLDGKTALLGDDAKVEVEHVNESEHTNSDQQPSGKTQSRGGMFGERSSSRRGNKQFSDNRKYSAVLRRNKGYYRLTCGTMKVRVDDLESLRFLLDALGASGYRYFG